MKHLTLYLFFINYFCFANDAVEISVLTCTPGSEIYSVFGHSAIRVVDSINVTDTVYNFGVFDFDTPNFTLKFISGELQYRLGKQQTQNFITEYTLQNRVVTEQLLHLKTQEKLKLLEQLEFLYQPENRYYTYSFLKRNCATEIRDILIQVGVLFTNTPINTSNRALINTHLKSHPSLRFGTDLLLGKSLDAETDRYQSMFLPQFLYHELHNATINTKPLIKSEHKLNPFHEIKKDTTIKTWISPTLLVALFFLAFLFWFPKPVALVVCTITGIAGVVLIAIWLFNEHPEVKSNMNILWCNPLYLAYIPLLLKNKTNKMVAYIVLTSLLGSLLVWILKIQVFDTAVAPILGILGLLNWKLLKKQLHQI